MIVFPASRARLTVDLDALAHNYRVMVEMAAPAAAGAAVKADCYGLGIEAPTTRLWQEGCRDFFVATIGEAAALRRVLPNAVIHVLNGILPHEVEACRALHATPVLNTPEQVTLWQQHGGGGDADLMIDTGINRLGVRPEQLMDIDLSGFSIDILLSHLASADEPEGPLSTAQRERFEAVFAAIPARRRSLANSAGIAEGNHYHFDLVRPGIALYGGIPHPRLDGLIRPVAHVEVQVIQVKTVPAGETIGYNATWQAPAPTRVATLAIGYADGYMRGFSNRGHVVLHGQRCPVIGRVSMDLLTVDISAVPDVTPGDWATVLGQGISLEEAAAWSGLSQYELLTVFGHRYERRYIPTVHAHETRLAP